MSIRAREPLEDATFVSIRAREPHEDATFVSIRAREPLEDATFVSIRAREPLEEGRIVSILTTKPREEAAFASIRATKVAESAMGMGDAAMLALLRPTLVRGYCTARRDGFPLARCRTRKPGSNQTKREVCSCRSLSGRRSSSALA